MPEQLADLVVVSPEAYDSLPTNKHQVARRFAARGWRVVYINARPIPPLARRRPPWCTNVGNVRVVTPYGLPRRLERRFSWAIQLNQLFLLVQVSVLLNLLGVRRRNCAVIVYFPFAWRCLRLGRPSVFHLVDHFQSFPEWAHQAAALEVAERRAAARADQVWVSSPALAEFMSRVRADTQLFPNVADITLFGQIASAEAKPQTAAFAGALSSHKVDWRFLHDLVDALPHWDFHLFGPITDDVSQRFVSDLTSRGNVTYEGVVPHDALPSKIALASVLLLPYSITEHTRYVLPLKLFEYLATGRRVVATPLESLRPFGHVLDIARSGAQAALLMEAQSDEDLGPKLSRLQAASQHGWDERITVLEAQLRRLGG